MMPTSWPLDLCQILSWYITDDVYTKYSVTLDSSQNKFLRRNLCKMSWISFDYVKYPTRNLHLGHQKLSQDEIDEVVDRLSIAKERTRIGDEQAGRSSSGTKRLKADINEPWLRKSGKLEKDDIDALVDRLSKETMKRSEDVKNEKTIVTSYAWCNGKLLHFNPKPLDGTWH